MKFILIWDFWKKKKGNWNTFLYLQVSKPDATNTVCKDTETVEHIKQAISLPDRIIFSTPASLYEIFGFYGFLEDASLASLGSLTQVLPANCVKEIVLSTHTYAERVVVLAIGSTADKEVVWVAEVQTGRNKMCDRLCSCSAILKVIWCLMVAGCNCDSSTWAFLPPSHQSLALTLV